MSTPLAHPKRLVAPVAHVASGHLAILPAARRTGLRLAPTLPANRLAERRACTAGAPRVRSHARAHSLHAMLDRKMGAAIGFKFKVFGIVVQSVSVAMVHDLDAAQAAAEEALHDETMLHHPAALRCVWMLRHVDLAVDRSVAKLTLAHAALCGGLTGCATLSVLDLDRMQARLAHGDPGSMGPTEDLGRASRARKLGGRRRFHAMSVPRFESGRIGKQQQEWLTMNREPAHRVAVQAGLFGGAA